MKNCFLVVLTVVALMLFKLSYAKELVPIKIDESRNTFALKNTKLKKGQTVFIYSSKKELLAIAKLLGCKNTYCYG